MRSGHALFLLLFASANLASQTKVSLLSGSWNNPAIWLPVGVPTSTDNVMVSNLTTVSINSNAVVNSLIVGGGSSGALNFSGNAPRSFSVNSDLLVNTLASLSILNNSNVTHSLYVKGNVVNSGTLDLAFDNNSLCTMLVTAAGSRTISGNGAVTDFSSIVLNMGSGSTTLEVTSAAFTCSENFLTLQNGTFKLSTTAASTLVPFTGPGIIPSSAGLWLNSPAALISSSAGVTYAGSVTIQSGRMQIGNAADEDLTANGGRLSVRGGSLSVAGKFYSGTAATTFSMTGGRMTLPSSGSTDTLLAPFTFSSPASTFVLQGGRIIVLREGGTGTEDLGFLHTGAAALSTTGGTIQIGDAITPASQTIGISSSVIIPNLVVNSFNAHAKFAAGTHTVISVTVNSGSLISNKGTLFVTGDWTNSGGLTTGIGVIHFSSSTPQTISRTGGESFANVLFSGAGIKTLGSDIATTGGFTVAPGATVDISAANYSVSAGGDFINNGSFNVRNGSVVMTGSSAQRIGGSTSTSFYDLRIASTSSVFLQSAASLQSALTISSGTLFTNNQNLTFLSNSSTTARIAQITGGDIVGNIIQQRHVPGGSTGWALLGAPISSLNFTAWDDDMAITCASCPDGFMQFTSIYGYDETVPGTYDASGAYVGITSITNSLVPGRGYWVYTGTAQYTTAAIPLDMTGAPVRFNFSIPLLFTNLSGPTNDGWNLIANPYPSPISWSALRGGSSTVDDAIYVYNADLGSGKGGYASFVNGISSPAVASGGIGNVIPIGQGFYVHCTAPTTLTAQESNKISGNQALLKSSSPVRPLLRLNLAGKNRKDEAVLYFESGASRDFDAAFDAYKMGSSDPLHPHLSLVEKNALFQVNGVQQASGTFTMMLRVRTGYSGTYTISASEISGMPKRACLSLVDQKTNIITDLSTAVYTVQLSAKDTVQRFMVRIVADKLNVSTVSVQPSCANPNGGAIIAAAAGAGPWNYAWKRNNQVVRSVTNSTLADTYSQLAGGDYVLEVYTSGKCDYSELQFSLDVRKPVFAIFSAPATVTLGGSAITFTNHSVGASSYTWTFGGGEGSSQVRDPQYVFQTGGNKSVMLIAANETGCVDTVTHLLSVNTVTSGLNTYDANHLLVRNEGGNTYRVTDPSSDLLSAVLLDGSGRILHRAENRNEIVLQLDKYAAGIYYVTLLSDEGQLSTLKLIRQ